MTENLPSGSIKVVNVIDYYRCAINKGSNDGMKIGQRLLVYGIGDRIIDPDTGENLGRLEIVRGRGIVTHVQERLATLETYEKEQPISRITKNSFRALMSLGETVEEMSAPKNVQFKGVQKGDYAKFI